MLGIPRILNLLTLLFSLTISSLYAENLSPEDTAFFESKIRPLLVENCYKCHAADSEKIRGKFLLDSKPGLLRGGESGSVISLGNAEDSLLVKMVQRHPDYEAMPPKNKLSQTQIDDLITWINIGAPDPRIEETEIATTPLDFDLEERKKWWSLQPIAQMPLPKVVDKDWPDNGFDHFILSKLEEKSWSPAPNADRHSLLRRLSFDLIGLAPTPSEVEYFLNDTSSNAYEKQIQRLLDSPHFGEKWARNWMDIVRYAETKSFENDYTMPGTYHYRDYLINAFNEDIPYDEFIVEAIAGDLLKKPRSNPKTGDNESIKGPGYIYLTDGQHGPPDMHEDEARIFDSMIDVTSKAFLGTTIACARCHDHKFDAVTTADYYSIYGMLRSSRLSYANAVPQKSQLEILKELKSRKTKVERSLYDMLSVRVYELSEYLAAKDLIIKDESVQAIYREIREKHSENSNKPKISAFTKELEKALTPIIEEQAKKESLSTSVLKNWVLITLTPEIRSKWPELAPLFPDEDTKTKKKPTLETSKTFQQIVQSINTWIPQELAFQEKEVLPGSLILSDSETMPIQAIVTKPIVAGQYSSRISGALRSPDFILDGKPIIFQAKGNFASIRLVVRNYELTGRGPTTGKLYAPTKGNHWQTFRINTDLWEGEPAYLEIVQNGQATHSLQAKESERTIEDNGYVMIDFSDQPNWTSFWESNFKQFSPDSISAFLKATIDHVKQQTVKELNLELLSAFIGAGLIDTHSDSNQELSVQLKNYLAIANTIPQPRFVRSLVDGTPQDEPVYIRGSHNNLSKEPNPRRFLDGINGERLKSEGSGRLEWAQHVATPENPLTSRVIVNRLWKQIYGTGLVSTTNDFGQMSSPPKHPELLDYLARDFTTNGWSIKNMIGKLVSMKTYQMSTQPSTASLELDPTNALLQHMPIKRLEAEAIRDHILASSNELDKTLFGPSVEAFVDDHPNSRAKPNKGPLDGDNRRSIYLELRRSFLPTFLRAFDMPNATESTGARQVTNVPAQSLALMNDPFIHLQAEKWAEKILNQDLSTEARINEIHQQAFSRPATEDEQRWARSVLQALSKEYQVTETSLQPWSDLCHIMMNRKEFIYLL